MDITGLIDHNTGVILDILNNIIIFPPPGIECTGMDISSQLFAWGPTTALLLQWVWSYN